MAQTQLDQPRPVQITKQDAVFRFRLGGFDVLHLRAEITPVLAVVDNTIDSTPRVAGPLIGEILPATKGKREEVGVEMRKNDIGKEPGARPFEEERKLFAANLLIAGPADVAVGGHPCFHTILFCLRIASDHNGTAGVVFGDLGDNLSVGGK